jgi:hypothetical protein
MYLGKAKIEQVIPEGYYFSVFASFLRKVVEA